MHRADTLVTEEEDNVLEIEKIRKALGVCVDTNGLTSQSRMLVILKRKCTTTSNTNKGSVVIPYVGGGGGSEGLR